MAACREGQVIQNVVGISRRRSFSMTLGRPAGHLAATRNGAGSRPSWSATVSRSFSLFLLEVLRDDVHLLAGFYHAVALASGAFDAFRGFEPFGDPLPSGVLLVYLLEIRPEGRDAATVFEDLLERER